MPATHLLMKNFGENATPRKRFSKTPPMTIQQAFTETARALPEKGSVVFDLYEGAIVIDVYPFCGPGPADATESTEEPTHLSYQFFPAYKSALIWRIKGFRHDCSDYSRRVHSTGIGAALIASQYPFWQKMGIESLAVSQTSSRGFYERLGFVPVNHLPELPKRDPETYSLMRLDFNNPGQKACFLSTIEKSRSLSSIDLAL